MADASTVNTRVDNAIVHIDAGEWAAAEVDLLAAKAALASLPEGRQGPTEVRYDRNAIDDLLDRVNRKIRATLQRSGIRYIGSTTGSTSL